MTAIRSPWSRQSSKARERALLHTLLILGGDYMKKLINRLIYYLLYRQQCSGFCVTCKYYDICKEELTYGK